MGNCFSSKNIQDDSKNENMETHNIKEAIEFSNLLKRDDDLKDTVANIEEILNAKDIDCYEKLRKVLLIMKEIAEPGEETFDNESSIKDFKEKFVGLVERFYHRLFEKFKLIKRSYVPLIKLLQIFELMIAKFLEQNHEPIKKDLEQRVYSLVLDKFKEKNWRFLRKLCDQREDLQLECSSLKAELVQAFLNRVQRVKQALLWKEEKQSVHCAEEIVEAIENLARENREAFINCLLKGRFDKNILNSSKLSIKGSMVLGDEGGLYLLLNSVPAGSFAEAIILESGVSKEFLEEKRNNEDKVIIGKGAFGSVRLALSVFGDLNVDIGQLVCVKKSLKIGKVKNKTQNTLKNIMDSTLEDFFAKKLNESVHAPRPLDMALTTNKLNDENHRKGYLIMEVVPENTADKVFIEPGNQKWELQKPYIVELIKTMYSLLIHDRLFNSDLKPQNTLFDPLSRKMAIIDLGSSLFVEKEQKIESFDIFSCEFGKTDAYCPPEILEGVSLIEENDSWPCDLTKAIGYLCGVTIAEVTSSIPEEKSAKKDVRKWGLAENTDLPEEPRKVLLQTINGLLERDPKKRLDINQALKTIELIGSDEDARKAMYIQYVVKLRELIARNPGALNLNMDINEAREKGVIEQRVALYNPKRSRSQATNLVDQEFNEFIFGSESTVNKVFVLFGEAGSGKSLALQLRFIKEVNEWQYGKALPVYFNLAEEVDLERAIRRINDTVGCNLKIDSDNGDIHLFIDSYDEGPGNIIKTDKCNLIDLYLEKLKSWKSKRVLVSCRTDFIFTEGGEDDFTAFKAKSAQMKVTLRYIVPIGYDSGSKICCIKCLQLMKLIPEIIKKKKIEEEKIEDEAEENNEQAEEEEEDYEEYQCHFCGENKTVKPGYYDCEKGDGRLCLDCSKSQYFSIFLIISDWLTRENIKEHPFEIYQQLKKRTMVDRMKTGLMFNMIMKIITGNKALSPRPRAYELYGSTIKQEFILNIEKVISQSRQKKKEEQIQIIENEIQALLGSSALPSSLKDKDIAEFSSIWEGIERIGERVASEMNRNHVNRLPFSQVESLIANPSAPRENECEDIRNEWKTLYQILKIMGMKLEKRKNAPESLSEGGGISETLNIGFRHETYKNYYLLRGLQRALAKKGTKEVTKKKAEVQNKDEEDVFLMAMLEQKSIISNLELLRLFGEEVRYQKDGVLREGLRKLLTTEQEQIKQKRAKKGKKQDNSKEDDHPSPRAAVIMSLLVAGDYSFSEEDLSDLDLTGANMRGGNFYCTQFNRTILRQVNLRHANLKKARFLEADIRGLDVGFCPDLVGHEKFVMSVSFSNDGKSIASGSQDKTVKIWNSDNGDCLQTLEGHSGWVFSVNFSRDGKRIASGSDDMLAILWDSKTGKCLRKFAGHQAGVRNVCLRFDGESLATGSEDFEVKIWDCKSGRCTFTLQGHTHIVYTVSFSHDGSRLASGSIDKTVRIWNTKKGECERILEGHTHEVLQVCFSSEGGRVASCSSDLTIKIWDALKGECQYTLTGHTACVRRISFSPDGKKLASGANDLTVRLWDTENWQCVSTIDGFANAVCSISFSSDGKKLAVVSDQNDRVKIFADAFGGECVQPQVGHTESISSVGFSDDGQKIFTGSADKTIKVWDATTGECLQTLPHFGHVNQLQLREGDVIESHCSDRNKRRWVLENGEYVCKTILEGQASLDMGPFSKYNPEETLVATCINYTLEVNEIVGDFRNRTMGKLRMRLRTREEGFKCEQSVFERCIVDKNNGNDLALKSIITQNEGFYE